MGPNGTPPALGGPAYGNPFILPLIGGSGGGGSSGRGISFGGGCGSGGGAILIASSGTITLSTGSLISVSGGRGGDWPIDTTARGGSGGAIRLIANVASVSGTLQANESITGGADGRIRIEADMIGLFNPPDPIPSTSSAPGPVFPPADAPTLKATLLDGVAVPADPDAGILTTELDINTLDLITIDIEATTIPAGVTVEVRAAPSSGDFITATSTPLAPAGGGLLIATAELALPHGRTEIHLRANWTP